MVQFEWNLIDWEIEIRSLAVRNCCEEELTQAFDQTLSCIMFALEPIFHLIDLVEEASMYPH